MKIKNIGASSAILESNGKRILFDPWLDDPIVYGSFFHWPPLKMSVSDIGKIDYVYISHIHEDHCSPKTIKHLNKDAEIILMDREPKISNYVKNFLKFNNFEFKKIHLIKPYTKKKISENLEVSFVEADENHIYNYMIDSGIIIKMDDVVVYNANDCSPCDKAIKYIKNNYKKIDLALLPFCGGSGYPNCYTNLSHEEKMIEAKRIKSQTYETFRKTAKELMPKWTMPFADQFVIGGKNSDLNKYSPHPPSPQDLKNYFKNKENINFLLLNSGQTFDFKTETKAPNEDFIIYSEKDREKYINKLSNVTKYDHEHFELSSSISVYRLVEYASKRMFSMQDKYKYFPEWKILFEINKKNGTSYYLIDLKNKKVSEIESKNNLKEPYLIMSMTRNFFILLLLGHISYNMCDGAFFINYTRVPNKYEPKLYTFLNFFRI